jgi:superfamily II RNA helicase
VVLVQSDRFDGQTFRDLTARDLHQMIGRAGRRGKDRIGFAVVLPGPYQDPGLLLALKDAPPESLESRIHINFSMTLNLLLSHTPEEIEPLLERSFAAFQRGRLDEKTRRQWEALNRDLKRELSGARCDVTDPFEVLEYVAGREEMQRSLRRQKRERRKRAARRAFEDRLEPGRLFLHKKGGIHMAFDCFEEEGTVFCESLNVEKPVRTRGKRVRLRRVRVDRIELLFDRVLELPPDPTPRAVSRLLEEVRPEDLEVLRVDPSGGDREEPVQARMDDLPCELCPRFKDCHTPGNRRLRSVLREMRSMSHRIEGTAEGLRLSFKRHLRFLKETDFVDPHDHLTPDGEWASKLRLDHPLLIAEAIRKGAFAGASPEVLAGLIAPFVWDRDLDVAVRIPEEAPFEPMERAWGLVVDAVEGIRAAKTVRGFPNPRILSWPAAALYLWAGGISWEELLLAVPVDEGDMASLVTRTADHLRQVAGLEESHPDLAARAEEAVSSILREPVVQF